MVTFIATPKRSYTSAVCRLAAYSMFFWLQKWDPLLKFGVNSEDLNQFEVREILACPQMVSNPLGPLFFIRPVLIWTL